MTYWYEVGVHPNPTEDDLPVVVMYSNGAGPFFWQADLDIYHLSPGDRWCHLTLPTETAPPPEDEGVEVEGVRYRVSVDGATVEWRYPHDQKWSTSQHTEGARLTAKVAIALGLVDPPVPVDPILAFMVNCPASDDGCNSPAICARREGCDRFLPPPVPADSVMHRALREIADLGKQHDGYIYTRATDIAKAALNLTDYENVPVPADTSDPEPEPTDGPWKVMHAPFPPWDWAVGPSWMEHRARCRTEADAIKVRDALNATEEGT